MPFSLLKFGLNKDYPFEQSPDLPQPSALKPAYDVVIIGGGGHGVATAYYLAKYHGITNVAVLEKAYLGGGNTARNTAVIRSNYLTPQGVRFYTESVRLFERLSNEFDQAICTFFSASLVATLDFSYQSASSEGCTMTYLAGSYVGSLNIFTSNMNHTACGL